MAAKEPRWDVTVKKNNINCSNREALADDAKRLQEGLTMVNKATCKASREAEPTRKVKTEAEKAAPIEKTFKAMSRLSPYTDQHLPLCPGDVVSKVLVKDELWWEGETMGRTGCFPRWKLVEINELQDAAWQRIPDAQCELGERYIEGVGGVALSAVRGMAWLMEAADGGCAHAMCVLASLYEDGVTMKASPDEAHKLFAVAAKLGHPAAQFRFASMCEEQEEVQWYECAAAQGNAMAQAALGWCYENGYGVSKDLVRGFCWYMCAAEQGQYGMHMHNVGICYMRGLGCKQDFDEAAKWFLSAIDLGYLSSGYDLALLCDSGMCSLPVIDPSRVTELLCGAADQGDTWAMHRLGEMYRKEGTHEQAFAFFKRAAELGHCLAARDLGMCYLYGNGVKLDSVEGVRWFRQAAEHGDDWAQLELGHCLMMGTGVARDAAEAVHWWRRAAEAGQGWAQLELGRCLMEGWGVTKNPTDGFRWFETAAHQGLAAAQLAVALAYQRGAGVMTDAKAAVRWLKEAAGCAYVHPRLTLCRLGPFAGVRAASHIKLTHGGAYFQLGNCYLHGVGVQREASVAVLFYLKAAEMMHARSMTVLGSIYEHGNGVVCDLALAKAWYEKAAQHGEHKAAGRLAVVEETLSACKKSKKKNLI